MLKNVLLVSTTLLLFVGCAERGYTLTTNTITQTVTAESITPITKDSTSKTNMLKKMTVAVKKALKTQIKADIKQKKKEKRYETKLNQQNEKNPSKMDLPSPKAMITHENEASKTSIVDDINEENRLKKEARKSKKLREAKIKEAMKLKELFKQKMKAHHIQSSKTINNSKIIESSTLNKVNQEELKQEQIRLHDEKSLLEQKHLQDKIEQEKREERQKLLEEAKKKQKELEAKKSLARQKRLKAKRERLLKESKNVISTRVLNFHQIDKVYHKFGTSEVHGHVIFLTPSGQETRLSQTKVYLLPTSAKLNNWYNNYYLKNKNNINRTVVNYLNKTSLDIEKNFEFYGVPKGTYYVIIEANYPSSIAKNKKAYIAKKIQVGKYKKIMGVFSKKL